MDEEVKDCWTCTHSDGCDRTTASRLLCLPQYRMGEGGLKENMALICRLHHTVFPSPYAGCGWDKEPGTDDDLDA